MLSQGFSINAADSAKSAMKFGNTQPSIEKIQVPSIRFGCTQTHGLLTPSLHPVGHWDCRLPLGFPDFDLLVLEAAGLHVCRQHLLRTHSVLKNVPQYGAACRHQSCRHMQRHNTCGTEHKCTVQMAHVLMHAPQKGTSCLSGQLLASTLCSTSLQSQCVRAKKGRTDSISPFVAKNHVAKVLFRHRPGGVSFKSIPWVFVVVGFSHSHDSVHFTSGLRLAHTRPVAPCYNCSHMWTGHACA